MPLGRVGGAELFANAWQDLETHRLAYYTRGGSLRLTESGCLGACARGHIRFSFACSDENLVKGIARVRGWVESLR